MSTDYYTLGGLGLMRVRRALGFLEPAYYDGRSGAWVVDGALLRYLVLEDRDEAEPIGPDAAREFAARIRRRVRRRGLLARGSSPRR